MNKKTVTVLLSIGLGILFLSKPVHLDETNFLALLQGDFWSPHNIRINWQGKEEFAFDVLSNPPGIAWWLWLVKDQPVFLLRLWMLPWTALCAWGAWNLGEYFVNRGASCSLLVIASPIFFLSNGSLMPDMPLMGCVIGGFGGLVYSERRSWCWAFLIGLGFLFRYSAITMIPLVFLWGVIHRGTRTGIWYAMWSLLPVLFLCFHDILVYQKWHFIEMFAFQSVDRSLWDILRKLSSALAMLAGGCCLPILCRTNDGWIGAGVGVVIGAVMVALSDFSGWVAGWSIFWIAAGGGVIANGVRVSKPKKVFLLVWLVGGLIFLVLLRFVATRYWAPFFIPAILLGVEHAKAWQIRLTILCSFVLGLGLAADDFELAKAQRDLAWVVGHDKTGVFAGHWGWQYYMEDQGWKAIDDDSIIPNGVYFASSAISWPQEPSVSCLEQQEVYSIADKWPGPRVHTASGRGNFHSYVISGLTETYAPWSWGDDPHDTVTLWVACQ